MSPWNKFQELGKHLQSGSFYNRLSNFGKDSGKSTGTPNSLFPKLTNEQQRKVTKIFSDYKEGSQS